MSRRVLRSALAAGAAVVAVAFTAGGWATITVEDLPDSLVAGEAVDLVFTIRQHGAEPISDRRPTVEWSQGASRERVQARRDGAAGRYVAQVMVRQPGEWSVTIDGDYGDSRVTLLPMLATGAGSHAPPAPSAHERGRRLFVAKGCFTCHNHAAIAGSGKASTGPDLSAPRYADEYVARLLADPSIMPRRTQWRMPDLDLKEHEIAALVAFLNGPSSGR